MAFVAVAEAGAGRAAAAGAGRAAAGRTAGSAAGRGAARKGAGRKAAARRPRPTGPATEASPGLDSAGQVAGALPPEGTEARRQRDAIEDIKASRDDDEHDDEHDDEQHDEGRRIDPPAAGAGLVLGVIVWAVVLNYIQGGTPQVRKLLRAKFLNQTD